MDDVYIIEDIEQLKVLSHPLRAEVVERLTKQPLTVRQLADAMGFTPNKLNYHVSELERAGLILVAETRQRGNLLEKTYRAAARSVTVDRDLFKGGPEGLAAWYRAIASVLDGAVLGLQQAIEDGQVEAGDSDRILCYQETARLSPERYEEFRGRLHKLLQEFAETHRPEEPERAVLALLLYPARE